MAYRIPRCRVVPLTDHQVSFQIDREERLRWHFGPQYSRPFIYPFHGPSKISLTRMGHPGTESHDHHRSIWFAHPKVLGINFWAEKLDSYTRQQKWLAYEDRDDEARMAVNIGWYDGHNPAPLINQQLVLAVSTNDQQETLLEIQATFTPEAETLELGQTTLGLLGIRVAAEISEYFGDGKLTNEHGEEGEDSVFGKSANWVDYSGPVAENQTEGITCFYHPQNFGAPVGWHVREDGWMSPSTCKDQPLVLSRNKPTTLRYLLWAHGGKANAAKAAQLLNDFSKRPAFKVNKSSVKHIDHKISRSK